MKFTITTLCAVLATASLSQASWIWADTSTGDPENVGATSLSFQGYINTSVGDPISGTPSVNNLSWDQPYQPIQFNITSNDGAQLSYEFNSATLTRLCVHLDPDSNGLATDLTIEVIYPLALTVRNLVNASGVPIGGATGIAPDMIGKGTADFTMTSLDATGTPIIFNNTDFSYLAGTTSLGSSAVFDNVAGYAGLTSNGNTFTTGLPFSPYTDATSLGSQTLRVTDINLNPGETQLKFSFDGGVPAGASVITIPEPTAFSLLGLGLLGFLTRRKR